MKKRLAAALSTLIVLNGTTTLTSAYSSEDNNDLIQSKTNGRILYLSGGGGTGGTGTLSNPFKDLTTAVNALQDGDTLKISGEIRYTYTADPQTQAALPLFINKKVTIEGTSDLDTLVLRAPIQLGADVTFKNMRLQMVSQVSIGREVDSNISTFNQPILGTKVERAETIFLAGHKLTLDNVNTKQGSSLEQNDERPFISGGTFKNQEKNIGNKAILEIKNPNSETRLSAIYAGDYYKDRDMDVEINLEGANNKFLVDQNIHLGGYENNLNGDVVINLGKGLNVTGIDRTNHIGKADLNLKSNFHSTLLSIENIDNLTLEENAVVSLPVDGEFNVKNINMAKKARIHFDDMTSAPVVRGDFNGVETNNLEECGIIILNNSQCLEIAGDVTGLTRLNSGIPMTLGVFAKDHKYIKAKANATGNFSVEGSNHKEFYLDKTIEGNATVWTAVNTSEKRIFKNFEWNGGSNKIIVNPDFNGYYSYPIKFIDCNNSQYELKVSDLDDFNFYLIKPDKSVIDYDDTSYDEVNFDFDINLDNGSIEFRIYNPDDLLEGNIKTIKLEVIHKATQKRLEKEITLFPSFMNGTLNGEATIIGTKEVGGTLSVDTSKVTLDDSELKYKWFVNDKEIIGVEGKEFVLTKEHANASVKVQVISDKHIGQMVETSEVVIKDVAEIPAPSKPQLSGNISIIGNPKVGQTLSVDVSGVVAKDLIYEWYVGGVKLENYSEATLTLQESQVGSKVKVRVTADGYEGYVESGEVKVEQNETEIPPTIDGDQTQKPTNPDVGNPDTGDGDQNQGTTTPPSTPEGGQEVKPPATPEENEKEVDKQQLKKYYDTCISKNYKSSKYTKKSFEKYEKALKEAKLTLNDDLASQEEVDEKLNNLKVAVNGLQEKSSGGGGSSNSSNSSSSNSNDSSTQNTVTNNNQISQGNANNNQPNPNAGWSLKGDKWRVISPDGDYVKGWYKDESTSKWYMLDQKTGDMIKGWYQDSNSKWYYMDSNSGNMVTGWHQDNGKWYYLDQSGEMKTGWIKDAFGKWYHLSESGAMNIGWYKDSDGKWYYLNSDGSMAVNTIVDGYKIGSDGAWIK